ncbi:hypothetical protein S83_050279, partial [Arachis hypogaea]
MFSSSQVSSSTPAPLVAASVPTTAAPLSLFLSPLSSDSHIFSAPQPSSPPVNASSNLFDLKFVVETFFLMVFQFLVFPFTALSFFFCYCFLLQCDSDPSTWSYINDHVHFHIGQWYASLGIYDVAVKHKMEILACSHQSKATQELFLSDFLQTVKVFPDALFHQLLVAMAHPDLDQKTKMAMKVQSNSFHIQHDSFSEAEHLNGKLLEGNTVAGVTGDKNVVHPYRDYSFTRALTDGKEDLGSLRLSSHQVSLLLSSIWVQATSVENSPANFEAMAHIFSISLLFTRSKVRLIYIGYHKSSNSAVAHGWAPPEMEGWLSSPISGKLKAFRNPRPGETCPSDSFRGVRERLLRLGSNPMSSCRSVSCNYRGLLFTQNDRKMYNLTEQKLTRRKVGSYHASSLLVASRPPTPGVLSRGIGLEGLTSVLAGLWGTGTGSTTITENVHTIAVTKMGSRRAVQLGACFLIVLSLV